MKVLMALRLRELSVNLKFDLRARRHQICKCVVALFARLYGCRGPPFGNLDNRDFYIDVLDRRCRCLMLSNGHGITTGSNDAEPAPDEMGPATDSATADLDNLPDVSSAAVLSLPVTGFSELRAISAASAETR